MSVGEIRDGEGNLFHPGIDGMSAKELRYWRQLWFRRMEEAKK